MKNFTYLNNVYAPNSELPTTHISRLKIVSRLGLFKAHIGGHALGGYHETFTPDGVDSDKEAHTTSFYNEQLIYCIGAPNF